MKVLFVHQGLQSFVRKDFDILRYAHEVRDVEVNNGIKGIIGKTLEVSMGVFWCDVTFSWFGKLHAFLAVLFSKILGKKAIVVAGGDDVANAPDFNYGMLSFWWKRWCPRFVFKHADLILPVSEFNERETLVNTKANPRKVIMIYHGFLADFFKRDASIKKQNIVITIGYINKGTKNIKGLKLFIEAAKLVPNAHFLLIGPDNDGTAKELKNISPENVIFLGGVYGQELVGICSRAKVYVQASVRESFGCSLAEAMLCECIPVVSKNGAIPEVVGDIGIYVDKLTPENLAEKIRYALTLPDDYGAKARNRIIEKFPLDKRSQKILEIIERIANEYTV